MVVVNCAAEPADQDLVASVRGGEIAAFGLLFERHEPALRRRLTRLTGDPHLAEDLVQDTFVQAWRHLDQLNGDASFAAWLHRIARNELWMAWRRQRLRSFVSFDWVSNGTECRLPQLRQMDASTASVERDAIDAALRRLSPKLREVFLLRIQDDFPVSEIAMILNISIAATYKRLERAIEAFGQNYEANS